MLANYHTHSTYCDGKNTLEEIVLYAIENGCPSIGFSGHGYTPFDLRYCMKETEKYIEEVSRLKNKYNGKIEIYCGIEEDAFSYIKRDDYDYIIGSSHYIYKNGEYYPIDSSYERFKKCLELYNDDVIKFSTGNQIIADSIVKKGFVEVNESMITGEPDAILKQVGDMLYSGSFVVSGTCYAQAENVGKNNYIEKLAMEAKKQKDKK